MIPDGLENPIIDAFHPVQCLTDNFKRPLDCHLCFWIIGIAAEIVLSNKRPYLDAHQRNSKIHWLETKMEGRPSVVILNQRPGSFLTLGTLLRWNTSIPNFFVLDDEVSEYQGHNYRYLNHDEHSLYKGEFPPLDSGQRCGGLCKDLLQINV